MSVINQALREIDAHHAGGAPALSGDALLRRYAAARLNRGRRAARNDETPAPKGSGMSLSGLVVSVSVAALLGALLALRMSGDGGTEPTIAEAAPPPVAVEGAAQAKAVVPDSPAVVTPESGAPSVTPVAASSQIVKVAPVAQVAPVAPIPQVVQAPPVAPAPAAAPPVAAATAVAADPAPRRSLPASGPWPAAAEATPQPRVAVAPAAPAAPSVTVATAAPVAPVVAPRAPNPAPVPVAVQAPNPAAVAVPAATVAPAPRAAPVAATAPASAPAAATPAPVAAAVAPVPALAAQATASPAAINGQPSTPAGPASIDVQQRPDGAQALQAQASAALAAGDTYEAQRLLRAALMVSPSLHTARQALLAILARGDRGAAWLDALTEAAVASPERFGLLAARGLADGGRMDAALAALSLVPTSHRGVDYLTTAGLLAQRAGRHDLAADELSEALSRTAADAPTVPALRVALADSLAARGDAAGARQQLEAVASSVSARAELRSLARERLQGLAPR